MSGQGGQGSLLGPDGRPVPAGLAQRLRARASLNTESPPTSNGPDGMAPWGAPWAYDAQAWRSQDFGEWFPWVQSPDAEIDPDRDRVVARVRDLSRNDGWAYGALATMADATIGAVLTPQPAPNWPVLSRLDKRLDAVWADEFAAAAEAEWKMWAEDPGFWSDGARQMTLTEQFRLAFLHEIRDGDSLAVLLWDPDAVYAGGAHYATRVQIVDPDRLSNPYEMLDLDRMRGGVEIDALGAPVAYWLRRAEPNSWFEAASSMIWDRFPRETDWGRPVTVHSCERERAGQHRGAGLLTAVLGRFKMLSRYDQVSLQRAVLASLIGVFVKSPYDNAMVEGALSTGDIGDYQTLREAYSDAHPPVMMGGLRVPKLFPGESIEVAKAESALSEFDKFEHAVLRSIAAATGQTAEDVTRDYSRINYSSARAAMLSAWKTLERRRKNFQRRFAAPIYAGWLEEAVDCGRVPMPVGAPEFAEWRSAYAASEWIGPGRGWVDPVKERTGEILALDGRFGSLKRIAADVMGVSWRDVLRQQAVEIAEMKRLGVPLPDWAGGTGPPAAKVKRPL